MSANTKFTKQTILGKPPSSSKSKLYSITPFPNSKVIPKVGEMNALLKLVTSNSAPSTRESKVVKNDNVIASGMFRIDPSKTSRVDNVLTNKHVKASVRTKLVTTSQPYVISQENVSSNSNSSIGVESTAKARRPQPRSNTKNDRVPSASKSSCIKNKDVKVEEHHRNLLLSKNKKHMSSECNTVNLPNDKFKIVCAMHKQCLITVKHDVCMLNYVNDMNSHHGFVGYPFDYHVTLGFGSIVGGLDHVNPVIRLPLKHGISRVLRKDDHSNLGVIRLVLGIVGINHYDLVVLPL
ncbi:hypothetical protein Tco_0038211 [Tanacetum coccineum]